MDIPLRVADLERVELAYAPNFVHISVNNAMSDSDFQSAPETGLYPDLLEELAKLCKSPSWIGEV